MHKIEQIVKHFIKKSRRKFTGDQVQALAYLAQSRHLSKTNKPLFTDHFEAWAVGPICPHFFTRYKNTPKLEKDFLDTIKDAKFTTEELETLAETLTQYTKDVKNLDLLLEHLRKNNKAWGDARDRANAYGDEPCFEIIKKPAMKKAYPKKENFPK